MEKRDIYEQKLQARLDELSAQIDKFEARAGETGSDARMECDAEIMELRKRQDSVQRKLEHLRRSGDDGWESLKDGLEKGWRELGDAISEAASKFR